MATVDTHAYGILVDYNGVLADDELLHRDAFTVVLAAEGYHLTPDMYARAFMGRTDADGFRQLATLTPIRLRRDVDELVAAKSDAYRTMAASASILFPGAAETIERMAASCRLVLVTSSSSLEIEPVLKKAALARYFHGFVTAEDVISGKPDPEPYLRGLAIVGMPKDRVVVLEDSPTGIASAKSAGLQCIVVAQTRDPRALAGADLVVRSIADIDVALVRRVLEGEAKHGRQ